ncbi:MAG: molybdopterin-dependent oxidoreductase [Dehalococcoidia bacterium]
MDRPTEGPKLVLDALPVHPAPDVDASRHLLHIGGAVAHPAMLSPADLRARHQTTVVRDFDCEEGWTVPGLSWSGVRLTSLVEAARPLEGARWVTLAAGDFATTLAIEDLADALVVLDLDDAPLPAEHGGPMRILVPGGACFTSIKWLDRIELTAGPADDSARRIALQRIGREPADPSAA